MTATDVEFTTVLTENHLFCLHIIMYVSLSLLTVTPSHGWRIGLGWPKPFLVIPLTSTSLSSLSMCL